MTDRLALAAFADEAGITVNEQIHALQENHISYLELRGVNGRNFTELSEVEAKDLKLRLDENDIKIWSLGSPLGKIEIGEDFSSHLEKTKHTLELATLLGTKKIRMFSFYLPKDCGEVAVENHREEVIDRLGQMCDLADAQGITLCHENEKGIWGDSSDRCLALMRALPRLRLVFDPANITQCGENAITAFQKMLPFADYIHIKDVDSDGKIVPPGRGICNIKEIVKQYLAQGGGVMTLEPHLMEFAGLGALEHGEKSKVTALYSSQREAFDDAACQLNEIINQL